MVLGEYCACEHVMVAIAADQAVRLTKARQIMHLPQRLTGYMLGAKLRSIHAFFQSLMHGFAINMQHSFNGANTIHHHVL